jgi:hypothetical protein
MYLKYFRVRFNQLSDNIYCLFYNYMYTHLRLHVCVCVHLACSVSLLVLINILWTVEV